MISFLFNTLKFCSNFYTKIFLILLIRKRAIRLFYCGKKEKHTARWGWQGASSACPWHTSWRDLDGGPWHKKGPALWMGAACPHGLLTAGTRLKHFRTFLSESSQSKHDTGQTRVHTSCADTPCSSGLSPTWLRKGQSMVGFPVFLNLEKNDLRVERVFLPLRNYWGTFQSLTYRAIQHTHANVSCAQREAATVFY